MELQGINRYPVLSPQGNDPRLKLAPVHRVRMQPQDPQLHYVAFGDQNTLPSRHDGPKLAPLYHHTPQVQRQPPLNFIPVSTPRGQPNPQLHNLSNLYVVPQQPQAQLPMNYAPEGYYFANPGYYVQHASNNSSNEYFNETATPMSFAQQPADQGLSARYAELEAEAESRKGLSYLVKFFLVLTGLAIICLSFAIFMAITEVNPCGVAGRGAERFCDDAVWFMHRNEWVAPSLLVWYSITYVFYKFVLQAYVQRRTKVMNGLFYFFAVMFGLSIITFSPIDFLLTGYLVYASDKLRKIFAEMEAIKTQLDAQKQPQTLAY